MSAYICSPAHIAALAAFAAGGRGSERTIYALRVGWNQIDTVRNVARVLMEENIRSVAARYPNDKDGERPGPNGYSDVGLVEKAKDLAERYFLCAVQPLKPLDIYSMANCYDYQACETKDYDQSLAKRQIDSIKDDAVRLLPGYDSAVRDYDGDFHKDLIKGRKPVLLSSLCK